MKIKTEKNYSTKKIQINKNIKAKNQLMKKIYTYNSWNQIRYRKYTNEEYKEK